MPRHGGGCHLDRIHTAHPRWGGLASGTAQVGFCDPERKAAAMCSSAAEASAIRRRSACAVSSRRRALRGLSPLIKRRIARSSIPKRREEAVVPPSTWMQWAKCSHRSCMLDGPFIVSLSPLSAPNVGNGLRTAAWRAFAYWTKNGQQRRRPILEQAAKAVASPDLQRPLYPDHRRWKALPDLSGGKPVSSITGASSP